MTAKQQKIITIFKPEGVTSLQALNLFRKEYPFYKNKKLGYAGTLDPLAEGLLLVLVEEENKKRNSYIGLSKKYVFSFILGFETDTYDVLGFPSKKILPETINVKTVENACESQKGEIVQKYPLFSSKKVKGKALFEWAREGTSKKIHIPSEKRTVFDLAIKEIIPIEGGRLLKIINKKIENVSGDFRQEKIMAKWEGVLSKENSTTFFIVSGTAYVSSGTYIRGIVHNIGEQLSFGATTLSITRTHIGEYSIEDAPFFKE